jgi:DNA helicase IV
MIVGPNPLFMQYIAYVLPSLGETAADQVSIDSLGQVSAKQKDDEFVARVKGDEQMIEVLRQAVVDRVRPPAENIHFTENGIRFSVTAKKIAELTSDFDPKIVPFVAARIRFRAAFERAGAEAYGIEVSQRSSLTTPTAVNMRQVQGFDQAVDRIWPTITAAELVRQLLGSEERLERAARGVLTETQRKLLQRKPVERLDQVEWSASDIPLVDEVQELLDPSARRYGHLVLDEAQDLTPMQLRMVGRRIRGSSVTVLGDLAQATGLWKYSTWDEIARHLGLESRSVEELTLAYRVPSEIMDLALPVLKLTAPSIEPPLAFRKGERVPDFLKAPLEERSTVAADRAAAAHAEGGTVAIIGQPDVLAGVREELERREIPFGDAERDELEPTIELLDPVAAKGLEFDHVVLVEPGAIVREASHGHGYRELYVALTRATRSLVCVHWEPLPWPLDGGLIPEPPLSASLPSSSDVEPMLPDSKRGTTAPAAPELSIGEALVLAQMRGLNLDEALTRALLARIKGATEAEAAAAILTERPESDHSVTELLDAARRLADYADEE